MIHFISLCFAFTQKLNWKKKPLNLHFWHAHIIYVNILYVDVTWRKKNKKVLIKVIFFKLSCSAVVEHKCPLPRYVTSHIIRQCISRLRTHTHTHALRISHQQNTGFYHTQARTPSIYVCVYSKVQNGEVVFTSCSVGLKKKKRHG